jgi:putative membrane protein
MRFIIRLLVNAAALWTAAWIVPGINYYGSWTGLVLVALVFGVLNAVVRPILSFLTCPFQILTLGLFTLVVNALMLMLTSALSQQLGLAFIVRGLGPAIIGALVVTVVSILLSLFVSDRRD